MAAPLVTVPSWVPNVINPKILFITENYPNNPDATHANTYFYRTLSPHGAAGGPNNLLNNLCNTLDITEPTELEKLNAFLHDRNYFLIDTFPHNSQVDADFITDTIADQVWIDLMIREIVIINPMQIVFTGIRSNCRMLPILLNRSKKQGFDFSNKIIFSPENKGNFVFNSPSDRAYKGFDCQIKMAIDEGYLIL